MDRDEAIKRIRAGLKKRSGKSWSVRGGRGTTWGWIAIISPPSWQKYPGSMTDDECIELSGLLGTEAHFQGVDVPASDDYRQEYVDRAEGRAPTVYGRPYWD
jgi:hypothetical protein